jgi:hypothetical protein
MTPEVLAHDARVDLGSSEEGQQNGAEAGEEVDPIRDLQADEVARNGAHHDLDESDGNRNARMEIRDARRAKPSQRAE